MPSQKLTDLMIPRLKKPKEGRIDYYDKDQRGLVLRVTATGVCSWIASYVVKGTGKVAQERLGEYPTIGLAEARELARVSRALARDRKDPRALKAEVAAAEEAANNETRDVADRNRFSNVAAAYIEAIKATNRTWRQSERYFLGYFRDWAARDIRTLKRRDVEALLDRIGHKEIRAAKGSPYEGRALGGRVAREQCMRQVRALMRWWTTQEDGYMPPSFFRLAKMSEADRKRDRVLTDVEIAVLWKCTDGRNGKGELVEARRVFNALIRMLLLSAQRRDEIANMVRSEIDPDGIWTLPRDRNKTKDLHRLPLTPRMRQIIDAQHVFVIDKKRSDLIFTETGTKGLRGFSLPKTELDARMLAEMKRRAAAEGRDPATVELIPWRIHDLRRTGRSLMERIGVRPDHAERVLGHRVPGIVGVYNQYDYVAEKRQALAMLDAEIMLIAGEALAKVVPLRQRKRARAAAEA